MPSPGGSDYPYNDRVLLAAVISLSAVVSFVVLLHVYARWLLQRRRPTVAVGDPFRRRHLTTFIIPVEMSSFPADGLDAKLVASLPRFVYKQEGHESGVVDCVICLSVMEEGEEGRVLPECNHPFHVWCIDMWLASHSTCPICRAPVIREEPPAADASSMVVADEGGQLQGELRSGDEELGGASDAVEGEVSVEMPGSCISSSSSSSSVGCSLKRMLSRSRSGSRVFPSVLVN